MEGDKGSLGNLFKRTKKGDEQKMRINKKYFKKSILIILLTVLSVVLITVFSNLLIVNGLESLFTIKNYKEAFKTTEYDVQIINLIKYGLIIASIMCGYFNLEANAQEMKLEKWYRKEMKIYG